MAGGVALQRGENGRERMDSEPSAHLSLLFLGQLPRRPAGPFLGLLLARHLVAKLLERELHHLGSVARDVRLALLLVVRHAGHGRRRRARARARAPPRMSRARAFPLWGSHISRVYICASRQ